MARMSLPPGFRFHPTDVELVMYYLKRKVMGKKIPFEAISELNIYKFSPSDLPDKSCWKTKDLEWFFFCPRERKYASGSRMNRATENGYWKTTGKDRPVVYENSSVGMVKTLVFHQGNAPSGQRTNWVIHEYRIEIKNLADAGIAQDAYVLCKVFQKSGKGPKNGAQYGAPFKEEEWDDDEDFPIDSLLPDGPSPVVPALPENLNTSAVMNMVDQGNAPGLSLNEPGPYLVEPSNDKGLFDGQNSSMVTSVVDPGNSSGWSLSNAGQSSDRHSAHDMILDTPDDDDILHLLAGFSDDNPVLTTENENNENLDHGRATEAIPNPDGSDPFNGLELDDLAVPLTECCVTGQMQTSGLYGSCNSSGSGGDFLGYDSRLTDSLQVSMIPDLPDRQVNFTSGFHTLQRNVYPITNAAHNLDFTSYRQQEEIRNAAGTLGRGLQQRQIFSRLQQLLESLPADPASAAYDGSSIHVKAEVTYRFNACTKDALSVMLGEVDFCLYLLVGPAWDRISEITGRLQHGVCSCFQFSCLMISHLIEIGWYLLNCFCFCEIMGFKIILDFVIIDLTRVLDVL